MGSPFAGEPDLVDSLPAAAFEHVEMPIEEVVATAWRLRALEADVLRRRIRQAPALFAPAAAEVAELEYAAAGAWATWWQFLSYGIVGRLP